MPLGSHHLYFAALAARALSVLSTKLRTLMNTWISLSYGPTMYAAVPCQALAKVPA